MDTRPWQGRAASAHLPQPEAVYGGRALEGEGNLWFNPGELFLLALWSLQLVHKGGFSISAQPGMDPPQEMRYNNTAHPHSSTNAAWTNPAGLLPRPPNG